MGMRVKKYLYIVLAVWLAFPCIVVAIWMTDHDLLIGTTGTVFLIQGILNCIAAVCGVTLAFLHYWGTERALKHKVIFTVLAAGMALLLLCGNFFCRLLNSGEEYHSFPSPDGTHTIVIAERVSPIAGQVTLYERVNPALIYPRAYIITNNGYRPVCAGKYSLVWQGDTVTLSVAEGAGGNKTVSVSVTLDDR